MALWMKALAAKPENLVNSLDPHGEKGKPTRTGSHIHIHVMAHAHTRTKN